ncbi:MAG: (2Fe-2S)-binding protein [Bradyrhizobiaceae bacterium]|nr:(2Fe-2S)-binding protein [Bradyrhizobiaceae bacterium]
MAAARTIHFILNGAPVTAQVTPEDNIVDMLSQQFDLNGARESCGQGLCGCCTVYVNSKAVSGCLSFAWFLDGATVETIEGLGTEHQLDPIQEAFIEAGAFQCGFCTPGFIMMAKKLLDTDPNPSDDDIRHYLVGNLCRCSAYPEIIDAIKLAAARRAGG